MTFVERMNRISARDWELLRALEKLHDNVAIPRDVEYALISRTRDCAEQVADFLRRQCDARAIVREFDGEFSLLITLHMPVRPPIALSVSGFMACVCRTFGLEYDGWRCQPQVPPRAVSDRLSLSAGAPS